MQEHAPPSSRQTLLGLFIVFQLAFLFASNILGFVVWLPGEAAGEPKKLINQAAPNFTSESSHGRSWLDQFETCMRRWTQLSGQDQEWSLFAPSVGKATGFPAVVLVWDEPATHAPIIKGTTMLYDEKNGYHLCASWNPAGGLHPALPLPSELGVLGATSPFEAIQLFAAAQLHDGDKPSRIEFMRSDNEPDDITNFFRYKNCRVRRYDGQLYINAQPHEDEAPTALAERASRRTRTLVRDYHDTVHAYMRWRLQVWQKAHPGDAPPKQVILFQRFYRIHGPDEASFSWDGPILYPIARWEPDRKHVGHYPVESFDYSDQRFYPLTR